MVLSFLSELYQLSSEKKPGAVLAVPQQFPMGSWELSGKDAPRCAGGCCPASSVFLLPFPAPNSPHGMGWEWGALAGQSSPWICWTHGAETRKCWRLQSASSHVPPWHEGQQCRSAAKAVRYIRSDNPEHFPPVSNLLICLQRGTWEPGRLPLILHFTH